MTINTGCNVDVVCCHATGNTVFDAHIMCDACCVPGYFYLYI